jgi:hypothetical protein
MSNATPAAVGLPEHCGDNNVVRIEYQYQWMWVAVSFQGQLDAECTYERHPAMHPEGEGDPMRMVLILVGNALLVRDGPAADATPSVVVRAGMTLGAHHNHIKDKADLANAIVRAEAQADCQEIETAGFAGPSRVATLVKGREAFLQATTAPVQARHLPIEASTVLGPSLPAIIGPTACVPRCAGVSRR